VQQLPAVPFPLEWGTRQYLRLVWLCRQRLVSHFLALRQVWSRRSDSVWLLAEELAAELVLLSHSKAPVHRLWNWEPA
jgi:hypothetical protein